MHLYFRAGSQWPSNYVLDEIGNVVSTALTVGGRKEGEHRTLIDTPALGPC
jgi:hypothetical protein